MIEEIIIEVLNEKEKSISTFKEVIDKAKDGFEEHILSKINF